MKIISKSVIVIDYEENKILERDVPASFDEYVSELIDHFRNNKSVCLFQTNSTKTEVISCIENIFESKNKAHVIKSQSVIIAKRLLREEIEAQQRVERMFVRIRKGSLLQVFIYDEENDTYSYLLAKVEHRNFVDDYNFEFKTGFSKDKHTIWKTCIYDLTNDMDKDKYIARVYSDTSAKYWSYDFLELLEYRTDEINTKKRSHV